MIISTAKGVLEWFGVGEVGASSTAMALAVAGVPGPKDHPHDPGDFHRCVKFLEACPHARGHLDKVAELSPKWKGLIDEWQELERLYYIEYPSGVGNGLYNSMKRILENSKGAK